MDPGEVRVIRAGTVAEVALVGEVDIGSASLDGAVARLVAGGTRHLVIDLAGVTALGSGGLASLLRVQRQLGAVAGSLVLRSPSRAVADVLDMTRLADRFRYEDGNPAA